MNPRLTLPLIFLHIFKAGGTSLRKVVRQQFPNAKCQVFEGSFPESNAWREQPQAERDSCELLIGHQHFGQHEFLSKPATYMTVLREPVDRVLSYYYFVLRYKQHYSYNYGFHEGMSIKELYGLGRFIELDNIQTRLLNPQPTKQYPFGSIDEAMFEVALENLRTIQRVGVVERMNDFLNVLRKGEGWSIEQTPHENRTSDRPSADAQDERTLELIKEHNRWDALLYEEARRLFEQDWNESVRQDAAEARSPVR